MKEPEILLAKTTKDPKNPRFEETLLGHTKSVVGSFESLFGSIENPSSLAEKWFGFFKLDYNQDKDVFYINSIVASCLHDIGKANNGFQEAIRGAKDRQSIRHEHISGLFLWLQEIRDWLDEIVLLDIDIVISAVIGHHLKAKKGECFSFLNANINILKIYPEGIFKILEYLQEKFSINNPKIDQIPAIWSNMNSPDILDLNELKEETKISLNAFRRKIREDTKLNRMLQAVRAALIISDSAGSGLVREGKNVKDWIKEAFNENVILSGSDIEQKIINPRIKEIEGNKGGFEWDDFQIKTEELPERSLLLAPCGSGKTLAAWRWIKAHANRNPVSRVIFLYPTRGTATEGFRDYISWAPEADAALIHGTSKYELDDMFENPDDSKKGKNFTTEDRLFALGYWQRRIFSATVDQFLGFMQNSYRSICLMPLLVDSIVVIDEVHSFDKNMFSALKVFLKNFKVPVLCMTASLPNQRTEELKECGLVVFPKSYDQLPDLQNNAKMPRYKVTYLKDVNDIEKKVKEILEEDNKKILWVVNTVDRCQSLVKKFNALCYHSRFKLDDRKVRHREIISAFQPSETGPKLAITTQVCEMSLDIDADILITESAPITSIIQRMGRCNRHARPENEKLGEVYIYPPESEKPYEKDDLNGVEDFIKSIAGKSIGQAELQELLMKFGPDEVEVERFAAFVECGPWAESRKLREDDYTHQVILDSDIEEYKRLKREYEPVDGLILSVPRHFIKKDHRLNSWLGVVDSSHYSHQFGFMKNPLEG